MTYRDDLAAAHERIAELEKERAEAVVPTREAARLAALEREKRHVLAELEAGDGGLGWVLGWPFYVPFGLGAIAFLLDGDPIFAGLAVVSAVFIRWVAKKMLASSRANARRHLEQLDAEIARLC